MHSLVPHSNLRKYPDDTADPRNRNVDALSAFYNAYKTDPYDLAFVQNLALIADDLPFVSKLDMITASVKIEVRNSDDQLVGYTESHNLGFRDQFALMVLEDQSEWKPIEINGEEFEVLEYSVNIPFLTSIIYPTTYLALIEKDVFEINLIKIVHDGFLTNP